MQQQINPISIVKSRLRNKFRRYCEALAYARNRLTASQANDIIYNCEATAGWYSLETFSVDRCLETALNFYWEDHPELQSLVQSACARVASKWSSEGHAADAAEDWALDLVGEFAAERGITLTRQEDYPSANGFETAETEEPDEALPL